MEFQYKGLKAVKELVPVTETEVDRRMEQLRSRSPRLVEVTDRPAQNGDQVTLDYVGTKDGIPFDGGSARGQDLVLGSGMFIPGFEEQLVGKNRGERVMVHVVFPQQYHAKELAGQKAVFDCTIRKICRREEYQLDDTFAKESEGFETLAELRSAVKDSLRAYYDDKSEEEVQDRLLRQAAENYGYQPTDKEVDSAVESQVMSLKSQLAQRNLTLEAYCSFSGHTEKELREDMRPVAVQTVKNYAVIQKIAELEKVTVTQKDMADALDGICRSNHITAEQLKEVYDEAFAHAVESAIVSQKVLGVLRRNAEVTEKWLENDQK